MSAFARLSGLLHNGRGFNAVSQCKQLVLLPQASGVQTHVRMCEVIKQIQGHCWRKQMCRLRGAPSCCRCCCCGRRSGCCRRRSTLPGADHCTCCCRAPPAGSP